MPATLEKKKKSHVAIVEEYDVGADANRSISLR